MSKTYSAGIVTAYGAAKRAGYQGTYEDFCRQQAGYAESAAAVEQAKNTAVSAANTATTKAGEATTAATEAQRARNTAISAARQALTDIEAARSGAISAVQTEGQTQTVNSRAQAQAAAQSATTASTKASEASASATSAGQSATNAAASATSAANAASAAQAVLNSIPEDYSDLSEDVGQLKADFNAIADHEVSRNLLDFTDMEEGYYINQNNGVATALAGQGATKYLSVEPGNLCFSSSFNSNNAGTVRYAFYNANKTRISGGTIALLSTPDESTARYYRTLISPENAAFIRISANIVNVWNVGTFQLEQGSTPTDYLPYGFDELTIKESALPEVVTNVVIPKKYKSNFASGNILDGEYLIINEKASVKKAETIAFSCDITEFSAVHVGYTNSTPNSQERPYAEITATQIIIHANNNNGSYNATFAHGLTIDVNLQFRLTINVNSMDFELISNGSRYANTVNLYKANTLVMPFAYSVGSTLTNCLLSWCPSDINKKIWMFGDSYFGLTNPQRWMYWLVKSGFADNALVDAYAGRDTANAIVSLATLIKFGKPGYIVWAMGMNDGSDGSSAPSVYWVSGVNYLLSLCDTYNIIPVFCTIPNVPTINHTKKNAWIKESGYRYIDFAETVGATAQGSEWYAGMLANDGVHPTEKGALALYGKAISNFPEVTITA